MAARLVSFNIKSLYKTGAAKPAHFYGQVGGEESAPILNVEVSNKRAIWWGAFARRTVKKDGEE